MRKRRNTIALIEEFCIRVLQSWWALGLASLLAFSLLFLASCPWWFNRFVLKVVTRTIEVSTSAPGLHEIGITLPKNSEVQIIGAETSLLPPELTPLADTYTGGAIRMSASRVTIETLSLSDHAGLIVRITPEGGIDIGILNDGFLSVAVAGTVQRVSESGTLSQIAEIERPTVWDIKPADKSSPARILLPPGTQRFAIYNQPISSFWFRTPRPITDDPRTSQSEITTGELQVLDTATKVQLDPRELILLEGGSRMLSRLELIDKGIVVDILGVADRISVGPPRPDTPFRLDRDLTPSVLSYVVGQHELKLAWGTVVAILGALWKARQWALSKQKL
jgi:hypothetical protein